MLSYFLSCVNQTHDMINIYHTIIISYYYPIFYPIHGSQPRIAANPKSGIA